MCKNLEVFVELWGCGEVCWLLLLWKWFVETFMMTIVIMLLVFFCFFVIVRFTNIYAISIESGYVLGVTTMGGGHVGWVCEGGVGL